MNRGRSEDDCDGETTLFAQKMSEVVEVVRAGRLMNEFWRSRWKSLPVGSDVSFAVSSTEGKL
jgi:hypothetical protein